MYKTTVKRSRESRVLYNIMYSGKCQQLLAGGRRSLNLIYPLQVYSCSQKFVKEKDSYPAGHLVEK